MRGVSPNALNVKMKKGKRKEEFMTKKETVKFIVQLIASIATAIVTALGTTSCMGIGA